MFMKRRLVSAALCGALVLSFGLSAFAGSVAEAKADIMAAAGVSEAAMDEKLTEVTGKVKALLGVGNEYDEFSAYTSVSGGITYYELNWSKKSAPGYVSARYGSDGNLYSYNRYYDYSSDGRKKLPVLDEATAVKAGEAFIKKALPKEYASFKQVESGSYSKGSAYQSFRFQYYKNGLPVDGYYLSVDVDMVGGSVVSYYGNMSFSTEYPDPAGVISLDAAKTAFPGELGLDLFYKVKTSYESGRSVIDGTYLAYMLRYSNYSYALDAVTGKRVSLYDMNAYGKGSMELAGGAATADSAANSGYVPTPAEQAVIDGVKGLLTMTEAEQKARALSLNGLDSSFKLSTANLNRSYTPAVKGAAAADSYVWNLYFKTEGEKTKSFSVSLDAKTGNLLSFYFYKYYGDDSTVASASYDTAKSAAEQFVKSMKPEEYKLSVLEPAESTTESQTYYYFTYTRTENGISFPQNTISVTYDAKSRMITSFGCNWYDVTVPSADGAMSQAQAAQLLYKDNPLVLTYRIVYDENGEQKAKLVYNLSKSDYMEYDAKTGKRLNSNGSEYVPEVTGSDITDIKGHAAEKEIRALYNIGVGLSGTKFNPDTMIAQKDFLWLLAQSLDIGGVKPMDAAWTKEYQEDIYSTLIRRGVLKESEVRPEAQVTREQAAVFLVRALGYEKLAEKTSLFAALSYSDKKSVDSKLTGYVSIAASLNILTEEKGKILPKTALSRADAAVLIYKFLGA